MQVTGSQLLSIVRRAISEAVSAVTPESVYEFIRHEADDRDEAAAFARATTEEVAERFGVPNNVALRALQKAAKMGLVTKVGRIQPGRGFQGNVHGAVGFQVWEVSYEPGDEEDAR